MPVAPDKEPTKPPAKTMERMILTISSMSSVEEKATNFLRPQNQLRRDAYSVDVIRVGSMMKKSGKLFGFENKNEILFPSAYNTPHITEDTVNPIITDAVSNAF